MVATFPLHEHEFVRSDDVGHTREMIEQIFVPHRLELVGSRRTLRARAHVRRLTDTALNVVTYGGEVQIEPEPMETFFTLHVTLSGTAAFRIGRTELTTDKATACVISPNDDVSMRWNRECTQLIGRIERPALEAHLSDLLGETLPRPLRFEPSMPLDHHRSRGIASMLHDVVHDIDDGSPRIDRPRWEKMFEDGLMASLLTTQRHNYADALDATHPAASSREVNLAIALIESRPESSLTLAGVAATVKVSGRSLQRALRRDLDMSFTDIVHGTRLRRVHDDLRRASPDGESVGDVLVRWNLPHVGATYAAYKKRFGQTPGTTLRKRP